MTLALGMPANERMDTLVEKATELGVAAIQPLMCERSVLRLAGERAERKRAHWQGVAVAACEQSGRTRVPRGRAGADAGRLAGARCPARRMRLLLSLRRQAGRAALRRRRAAALLTLSGPEGGLSAAEEARRWPAASSPRRWARACCAPTPRRWRCWPGPGTEGTMNRKLLLLALCQGLFLTNNVTFIAINGLVGLALAPLAWMATLPVTGYVAGGALSTGLVARHQRALGPQARLPARAAWWPSSATALCACAAWQRSFWLLVPATLVAGYYNANGSLYRFAAAELVAPAFKEKAISWVLAGGILGGVCRAQPGQRHARRCCRSPLPAPTWRWWAWRCWRWC